MPGEDSSVRDVTATGGAAGRGGGGIGRTKPIDSGNSNRDSDTGKPGTGNGNGRARTGRASPGPSRTEAETVPLGKPTRREVAEEAVNAASSVVESPKNVVGQKNTASGTEAQAFLELTLIGAFGSIAAMTGHPHWNKEAYQLLPITGPCMRYWNSLPKKTREALEKKFNGALFIGGCCAVIGPDLAIEYRLRKEEDAAKSIRRSNLQVIRGGIVSEEQQRASDDSAIPAPPPDAFVNPIG